MIYVMIARTVMDLTVTSWLMIAHKPMLGLMFLGYVVADVATIFIAKGFS